MDLSLFEAADGLSFWSGSRSLVLHGGRYPTGHGALIVYTEAGEPVFKLTVNMAEVMGAPDLAFDEFCVKSVEVMQYSDTLLRRLNGLFLATDQFFDAGFVKSYAEVWRFGKCIKHGGDYVVRCPECRQEIRERWVRNRRDHLARQSANMLRNRNL